ncbi:MAG: DUF2997 domain-containing protein, partial [archaeon]|nr:DUF2997 domain-containing protein [archaeon]
MAKQYKIKILSDGSIEVETVGFKGKQCLDSIDFLEDFLKAKVVDSKFTEDYYKNEELFVDSEESESISVGNNVNGDC